jgi:bifunctional UDP-N-acetylglucosamine pyrophosphorylase / glucosamine-1-phosphate N-acetyltransferase
VPMLGYVLRACYEAGCEKVMVVVGYGRDEILAQFGDDRRITWVDQPEQLGAGHAAKMCQTQLARFRGDVLIVPGDAPLLRGEILQGLLRAHREDKAAASIATALLDSPAGYPRIVRDAKGDFVAIVQDEQATAEQRAIREIRSSFFCAKAEPLCQALSRLTEDGDKREYDLSGVFEILQSEGKRIVAVQAATADDVLTVNTRQELAEIDLIMQDRIQRHLRDSGVTIVNSFNTYIESGVAVGPDTVIQPFTFIGRGSTVGSGCVIGPFARIPRDSVVPEATSVLGTPAIDSDLKI